MRLRAAIFLAPLLFLAVPAAHAEYILLRSGERLHVTGYQLLGDRYRLQLQGGWVDVQTADVVKIEPEEVFTPIPEVPAAEPAPANQPPYYQLVAAAASRYGVDAELITSVMEVESHFDPKAISLKNARGLMQLLPETAARLGVKDIFDPQQNIDAGTRYLKELMQLYNNDLTLALAAYNAGPDKVQKYGDVPPYRETQSYVKQVKRKYQKSKSAPPANPAAPQTTPNTPATAPPASSTNPPAPPAPPKPQHTPNGTPPVEQAFRNIDSQWTTGTLIRGGPSSFLDLSAKWLYFRIRKKDLHLPNSCVNIYTR
jgi:hypothetical protein